MVLGLVMKRHQGATESSGPVASRSAPAHSGTYCWAAAGMYWHQEAAVSRIASSVSEVVAGLHSGKSLRAAGLVMKRHQGATESSGPVASRSALAHSGTYCLAALGMYWHQEAAVSRVDSRVSEVAAELHSGKSLRVAGLVMKWHQGASESSGASRSALAHSGT